MRFAVQSGRETFEERTELIGEAASREKLTFALDYGLEVPDAEIALLAIYQDGKLRPHQGMKDGSSEGEDAANRHTQYLMKRIFRPLNIQAQNVVSKEAN